MNDDTLSLATRVGLPDALRVLLADYPKDAWQAHRNFTGIVQFWLERHLMFRRLGDMKIAETQQVLDQKADPQAYAARLSRFGGMLLNQLHGHHQIEDQHYFPQLIGMETRLERGFGILDKDHHDLDGLLNRFAEGANRVLNVTANDSEFRNAAGDFLQDVTGFRGFLERHLTDEEELIVPVLLKHGSDGLH